MPPLPYSAPLLHSCNKNLLHTFSKTLGKLCVVLWISSWNLLLLYVRGVERRCKMPEFDIIHIINFLEIIFSILHLHSHENTWFLPSQRVLHINALSSTVSSSPSGVLFMLLKWGVWSQALDWRSLTTDYVDFAQRTLVIGNWMSSEPSGSKVRRWDQRRETLHHSRWEHKDGSLGKVRVEVTQFHSLKSQSLCRGSQPLSFLGALSCRSVNTLLKTGPQATTTVYVYLPTLPVNLNTLL